MKFRYVGKGKESPAKILFMGTEAFTLGEVTDVQDSMCIFKLKANPCFVAVEDDAVVVVPAAKEEEPALVVADEKKPVGRPRKMAGQLFTPKDDE